MSLPNYYRNTHSSDLNKISGRLTEGREFISDYCPEISIPENSEIAFKNRWYGNASLTKCKELTRHFSRRYYISSSNFQGLRVYLDKVGGQDFPWINHFYMVLSDRYYRWATASFLNENYQAGMEAIPRTRFDNELKTQLPDSVGLGSSAQYGKNLLTAIRDNGLLQGKENKSIISPLMQVNTLAFMLYSLAEWGSGGNDFDSSPLFYSLLKPKDLLVPLFLEGERSGYWEFTGDREKIRFNFLFVNLKHWLKEGVL